MLDVCKYIYTMIDSYIGQIAKQGHFSVQKFLIDSENYSRLVMVHIYTLYHTICVLVFVCLKIERYKN